MHGLEGWVAKVKRWWGRCDDCGRYSIALFGCLCLNEGCPSNQVQKRTEPAREPETITLFAEDEPIERARKIWRLLGFANDRLNMTDSLALYLASYRDLDRKAATVSTGDAPRATPKAT